MYANETCADSRGVLQRSPSQHTLNLRLSELFCDQRHVLIQCLQDPFLMRFQFKVTLQSQQKRSANIKINSIHDFMLKSEAFFCF